MSSLAPLRLPPWVVNGTSQLGSTDGLKRRLRRGHLVTVCEEARCPNMGECFAAGTATFMLLGDTCTRRCSFCSVETGRPSAPDPHEPERIADTAAALGLRYVVVTTVARDDLDDEGAGQFAATIAALKVRIEGVQVEVLTADFGGRQELIERVLKAGPEVFGHNVETVRRLTPAVRGRARYDRSLEVLRIAAHRQSEVGGAVVKTGLMAGLGETRAELSETMRDIRDAGCSLLTIGQYLRPTRVQQAVVRYLEPVEFDELAAEARGLGFMEVACGPLVRSSYRADRLFAASACDARRRE
ncbi:MAG: lipoyl synthase [Deltaproteobacteria bacterium]|nr:lipoyl synthase [Deltaproteobacteria bacterium]